MRPIYYVLALSLLATSVPGQDDNQRAKLERAALKRKHIIACGPARGDAASPPEDRVNKIAWSPNGKLMASGHAEGSVRIFDAKTGKQPPFIARNQIRPGVGFTFANSLVVGVVTLACGRNARLARFDLRFFLIFCGRFPNSPVLEY